MKRYSFWILAAFIVGKLAAQAGEAAPNIDLSDWGAAPEESLLTAEGGGVILSPGGQLFRTVDAAALTLHLVSEPVFGHEPAELEMVEIGSLALTFIRRPDGPALKLMRGDAAPDSIEPGGTVDGSGRLSAPLVIDITWRGTVLAITANGRAWTFSAEPLARRTEIVLSSGNGEGWPIRGLALTTETGERTETNPDPVAATSNDGTATNPAAGSSAVIAQSPRGPSATTDVRARGAEAETPDTSVDLRRRHRMGLEVFTPSSVHRNRTEWLRVKLAETKNE